METSAELLYSGCASIPAKAGISKVSPDDISPASFFAKYVSTRTPVQFTAQSKELSNTSKWNDAYLARKCSDCPIKVEVREEGGQYGKGNEIRTTFGEFLTNVPKGSTYLTTQDLVYDEDGRPAIVSPPVTCLEEDIPKVPNLFSNLVVANVNMWFGHTTDGKPTTSGLHHDFHDNLYILLRGEKKITLISPAEAENLYTVGRISKVHPNGRINYHGQPQTRADGSDLAADAALKASQRLQEVARRLAQAGAAGADAVGGGQAGAGSGEGEGDSELEDELDRALEDVLDAEMMGEDDYDDEDDDEEDEDEGDAEEGNSGDDDGEARDDSEERDFSGSSEEGSEGESSAEDEVASDAEDSDCGSDEDLRRAKDLLGKGLRSALAAAAAGNKRAAPDRAPRGGEKRARASDSKGAQVYSETSSAPVSFSRIDTSLPAAVLAERFPLYAQALARGAAHEVTLKAGEMLYIPAGWFHEVRSRSAPGVSAGSGYEEGRGGHLALNYWFHPPDGQDFQRPYTTDFWKQDFEQRGGK
jgi:hypothetical protein